MTPADSGTRLGVVALVLAGLSFASFPILRPWHDETTQAGAIAAFGSGAWVAAHLFGVLGFVLVPLGLVAVTCLISAAGPRRLARTGAVLTSLGAGLLLPYFGAETFGLNAIARDAIARDAIARAAANGASLDVVALAEGVRLGAAAVTTFGLGLLAVAVGGVMAAVAIARSGDLPRHAGTLFAVGIAIYLPQFFTPPWVRITHGLLLGLGLLVLAAATWNTANRRRAVTDGDAASA